MIVADTHIILWDALQPNALSPKARTSIRKANSEGGILFCAISLWEIAMLMKKNRLSIDAPFLEFVKLILTSNNYKLTPLTPEIVDVATGLPDEINRDPADRMICATSIVHGCPLVTADKNLLRSKIVETIW